MERATEALHRIDAHEEICAMRYKSIDDSNSRIEKAVNDLVSKQGTDMTGIYNRLWIITGGIFACMFAVIMALVFKQ